MRNHNKDPMDAVDIKRCNKKSFTISFPDNVEETKYRMSGAAGKMHMWIDNAEHLGNISRVAWCPDCRAAAITPQQMLIPESYLQISSLRSVLR